MMPRGHTEKKTLTPYRAGLLRRLPLHPHDIGPNDRRQLNVMCLAGYVDQGQPINGVPRQYEITEAGRAALTAGERQT